MADSSVTPALPKSEVPIHDPLTEEGLPKQKRGILASARVRSVISRKDVHIAYSFLVLLSICNAFTMYSTSVYTAYATSAFKSHSLLAAAGVVSRVFSMAAYTIVPKLTDNIGRISPNIFLGIIIACCIAEAMMAGCNNVQTYIGANVFSGIGTNAYEMAQQIYIAETTNLVQRALWNVVAHAVSSIVALYSGSEVGGAVLRHLGTASGWRWGYGMWAIMTFFFALPFIFILYSWHRRVRRTPDLERLPPHTSIYVQLFHEYDIIGLIFFVAGWALVLVPVSRAKGVASAWTSDNIAMICVGFGSLILFGLWSTPGKHRPAWLFTPKFPFIPWHTLKNPTISVMFVINMFDFMSYATFTIYFPTFLQVAVRASASKATMIDNTLRIVYQVTALVLGLIMRFWTPLCIKFGLGERLFHTRWPIWIGIPLCTIGIAIDINFVQHPTRHTAVASFVIAKFIYGVGRGLFQVSSQVAIQAAAKRNDLAVATGIFYFAMSLGGAIGVAVAGAVWTNVLPEQLAANLPAAQKALASKIYGSIVVAMKYDHTTEVGQAILKSYIYVYKILAIIATCLQVPMLIGMFFVQDVALDENEQVVHGGKRVALDKKKPSKTEKEESEDEK